MLYCPECKKLQQAAVCAYCRHSALRAPAADDLVFLIEKDAMWAGMLMDVLKQNGIPFTYTAALGAALAMAVGPASERLSIYVPYGRLGEAEALVEELFAPKQPDEADGLPPQQPEETEPAQ